MRSFIPETKRGVKRIELTSARNGKAFYVSANDIVKVVFSMNHTTIYMVNGNQLNVKEKEEYILMQLN